MNIPVIHPIFVHFPISTYFLEGMLLTFYAIKKDESYLRFAKFCFCFAFISGLFAAGTGLYDTGGFEGISGPVRPHFFAALAMIVVQTGRGIYWKISKPPKLKILIITSLIGYALVLLAGFYGGELVYNAS